MTATLTHKTTPATTAVAEDWVIELDSGLRMALPPSMRSLSTHVMLEQQCWFEPEISLLPHLLAPGTNALDIGANHGVYALEMARLNPSGHVWAFEPTSEPRRRLQRSLGLNGLQTRVTLVAAGLSDAAGDASFAIQENSELNSRTGSADRHETVRLETLDGYLAQAGVDAPIGFVKLDAEGDELRVLAGASRFFAQQSPVVMFEFRHGARFSPELAEAFVQLGFGIFRWSAELALLMPFDHNATPCGFALNLVAVRPAQQALLQAQGVLVTADALTAETLPPVYPEALRDWCAQPALMGDAAPDADALFNDLCAECGADYATALAMVAAAHLQAGVAPADRVRLLQQVRSTAITMAGVQAPGAPAWQALLAHVLMALGQQGAALSVAQQSLKQWPAEVPQWPVATPHRADLQRARSVPLGGWLQQMLREFVAQRSSFSGCFGAPQPALWGELLRHPDHGAEVERRFLLAHALCDRAAPVQGLVHLPPAEGSPNAAIWQGLVQAMRAMAPAPRVNPQDVLAELPVQDVQIVDVGASELTGAPAAYAALVEAGVGRVTGFEPDAQALAQLQAKHGQTQHRYLPHLVGNGQPATFHATEWSLTASLLAPNRPMLDRYQALGELVVEARRIPVDTVRLDDVIAAGGMDLLKIDVQGAEMLVFDGAPSRLNECLCVWTEVEFVPLYEQQPLFAEIDQRLRAHGLQFLGFDGLATRSLRSWPKGTAQPRLQQQLWADAVYVPTAERIAAFDVAHASRLALIAHHTLKAWDLCHVALLRVDALQGSDLAPRYARAHGAS